MIIKHAFIVLLFLLVIGNDNIYAQGQKDKYLGVEFGPVFQIGNVERTDLEGLGLNNTLNPLIRVVANFELDEGLYLKTAIGLMTYSTNISFEKYSDPQLIREVPNLSFGLEKEIVKSGKLRPFFGFDIFLNSRPNMNSITITSPEGAKLIAASETEYILVRQATITTSSSPLLIYLMPSIGLYYQLKNKLLLSLSGSYGWNISEPLITFDYSALTLNGNSHSFKGGYSGDLIAFQVGLRFNLN